MKFEAPKGKRLCGLYCIRNVLDGKCYYGHKWSVETRHKMAAVIQQHEKAVVQLDRVTGILVAEFDSLKEAQAAVGIAYQSISRCCNGGRPSAGLQGKMAVGGKSTDQKKASHAERTMAHASA
jgi:hypothetical protein